MRDASFDDPMETQLTSCGPRVSARKEDECTSPSPTQAWSESESVSARPSNTKPTKQNARTPSKSAPSLFNRMTVLILCLQAAWAVVIPLKNIATVVYPTTRPDALVTQVESYVYDDTTEAQVRGTDIVPLLRNVLDVVLSNDFVRNQLEAGGSFDLDSIYKMLSLTEFASISKYYALVLQVTQFPGGAFTPRPFPSTTSPESVSILLRDSSDTSTDIRDIAINLACLEANAFLSASKCTSGDGLPCPNEYVQQNETRVYSDVDLKSLSIGSGLENNVGLMFVIEFFQQTMDAVFATQDWYDALQDLSYNESIEVSLASGMLSAYKNGTPYLLDTDALLLGIQVGDMQTAQLASCITTELTVAQFYTRSYVLHLVRESLVSYGLYDASTHDPILLPTATVGILDPIFAFNISITSSVQASSMKQQRTSLFQRAQVATLTTEAGRLKLDHKFNSANQVHGSSIRMLQYMSFYPELLSVYESEYVTGSGSDGAYDSQDYKLVGASGSGVNTFKDSALTTAASWMVFPLKELRKAESPNDSWWDDEAMYASWFQDLEASTKAPFYAFDTNLTLTTTTRTAPVDDNEATRCHRALFKVIGKVIYLALLRLSAPTSYLMFQSDVLEGHREWLLNQIYNQELASDGFFGERVTLTYRNGPYTRKDDGSAWVVVPILSAMVEYFGSDNTLANVLEEFDSSFRLFIKESNGDLNFPDTASCRVTGHVNTTDNSDNYVVTASDTLDEIYAKIYPGLALSMQTLVDSIPAVLVQMNTAMKAKKVATISLTSDQIMGNTMVTATSVSLGSPVYWQPSPLMAGLVKFWPAKTPLDSVLAKLRANTRCYNMLELRYLNVTTRCFAEPGDVQYSLLRYQSEALRKFLLSNWSMAIMLNTIACVIVFRYLRKLLKAWRVTKFAGLYSEVALQLNIQGMGVLSISQTLLLLAACAPSLIGFHIPEDPVFMPRYHPHGEKMNKIAIDFFVTLSMSWFLKLGFEVCNRCINPRKPVDGYYLVRLRWFMLVFIFLMRLATPDGHRDGDFLMWKLIITCLVSLTLGACCTAVVFLPERRGKIVDGSKKEGTDAVLAALVKQNLPLSRYGVVGRTTRGWSKAGLIVEGWRLVEAADGSQVLRKDGGEIPLPPPLSADDEEISTNEGPNSEVTPVVPAPATL